VFVCRHIFISSSYIENSSDSRLEPDKLHTAAPDNPRLVACLGAAAVQ
jgi:hypothetical protein